MGPIKNSTAYLAIDLGAESGRAILGTVRGEQVRLDELHRFPNRPKRSHDGLHWDLSQLIKEVERSLLIAAERTEGLLGGVAIDSWGVDYGLIDRKGRLLADPVHYRDERTEGIMETVFESIPRSEIFEETGLQFLSLNTLYQLVAEKRDRPTLLAQAECLLFIADLVSHFLTGRAVAERTLASTSQLWNPRTSSWSPKVAKAAGIPTRILPEVVEPGTLIAPLRDQLSRRSGFRKPPPVIACCAHDTASAIAAVPANEHEKWAYVSSGTWSMVGVELQAPKITPDVLRENFTNEGGLAGRVRFLRNVNGLWLIQECRREWAREDGRALSYDELTALALEHSDNKTFIDPENAMFFAPKSMPNAIRSYCEQTGQAVPSTRGAMLRCALESQALAYARVVRQAVKLTGENVQRLHIVGGGSRNELLNQATANAVELPTRAGPVEATALGNVLVQALATGAFQDINELRSAVRSSFPAKEYQPQNLADWRCKRETFGALRKKTP